MVVVTQDPLKTKISQERIRFLKESQFWTKEQFYQYQVAELKKLFVYCEDNIPYYQKVFKKAKVDSSQINDLSILKRLPLLTKKDIQAAYDEFIPFGIKKDDLIHRSTGGSTGTPLTVYADIDYLARDKSNTVFYMSIAGYDPFNFRSLRIYGDKIPEEFLTRGEFWYERDNKLILSCYHYSPETLPRYIARINEYKPDYIHSRPSALLPLGRYLLDHKKDIKFKLGAVFLDGEFLNDAQRNLLEDAFNCRIYNIYGHTEGCTVGISCDQSRLLHFMPQVGVFELLDESGREVQQEDQRGEMVVTGFNNRVFPLIRYRTFDIAVHTNEACPCGRNFRMIKSLEGRLQDFVVNSSGNLIPLAPAVFNYNDMDWKGIKQFQVHQDTPGKLLFKVQKESGMTDNTGTMEKRIRESFSKILGNNFVIDVAFVEDIPRTRIGKLRYLDQKIDLSQYPVS